MNIKRKTIGLYCKLKVIFVSVNKKSNADIIKHLRRNKYTFTIRKLSKIKFMDMFQYTVKVDSIDEAYKLKLKLKKLNK
jgi:tRNA/tmRNA/rRNA uracil-C5-methylase (TrmA/RlmC/RlmD family)